MKSLFVFSAIAGVAVIAALAQAPAGSPSPVPALSPAPAASPLPAVSPPPPSPPGNPHEAAVAVPMPGQSPGAALEKNIPLIPEPMPAGSQSGKHGGKSQPGGSPKQFATFAVEQNIRTRIHMREARTRAVEEPDIQADWAAAHHTPTDPERRVKLAAYYNHLYDRMIQIDPSITQAANAERAMAIGRLKYPRIADPNYENNLFATPTPSPSNAAPNPPDTDVPSSQ